MSIQTPETCVRANYDSPWKNVLNNFLAAFIEFALPKLYMEIDWSRHYIPLDKELQAISRRQKTGKRLADMLFKIWRKDGAEIWLLLHIEIQAGKEADFPERMYIYNYRAFDRYQQSIVSTAILIDANRHWRPSYYEKISTYNRLRFEFTIVKLLDYAEKKELLIRESNPFGIVVWTHLEALKTRKNPEQRLQSKLNATRALYQHGFSKHYILDLFYFIDWILELPEPFEIQYNEKVKQFQEEKKMAYITSVERIGRKIGWHEGKIAGKKEGRIEGELQGERKILSHLLQLRFGSLPMHYQKLLNTADQNQLLQWTERLLNAQSLEEIF